MAMIELRTQLVFMQALQLKPLIMRREHSEFTMFWPQNEPRNFS
jgi:hypothetical protein